MSDAAAPLSRRRIAIIGAGYVGSSIAYALTVTNLAREIILIDTNEQKAVGEALDIRHGMIGFGSSGIRAGDYSDCRDCDLIIITAGRNRRPGETRLELIPDNVGVMRAVVAAIKPHYSGGAIMVVSNPVDIMTYECDRLMGLPNGRVFGTGCVLDTSRLIWEIADYTGLKPDTIKGSVVGEHGDSQFPVWSRLSIEGIPMQEYCENVGLAWDEERRRAVFDRVRGMGAAIIAAKGRTHYGIATCICSLADAVLNQRSTIAVVTTPLQGEYGLRDVSLSVPSIIGANGVERRIEEKWTDRELDQLHRSAARMREAIQTIKI